MRSFKVFWHEEDGVVTAEYALLIMFIALASIASLDILGQNVSRIVASVNVRGFGN